MNKDKNVSTNVRVGLKYSETMSLILFTLKLLGIISCSWWVVFLPIIISWVTTLLFIAFGLIIGGTTFLNKMMK